MSETPKSLLTLQEKIRNHAAIIGVVGLGCVGLPFAVEKAKVGFQVLGIEQNPIRCETKLNYVEIESVTTNPSTPSAHTYYMAPNGSDSANGSVSAPWKTISYASSRLRPGDVLYARGGTYFGQHTVWQSPSGRADAPITMRAYPGEKPVFDGQGLESTFLQIDTADWITIDGLTIRNYNGYAGLYVGDSPSRSDPAEHVVLRNNTLTDLGNDSWQEHGIYISGHAKDVEISGNYIRDASSAGIHIYHKPAVDGARIFNNVIHQCARWGIVSRDGAQRLQVYNNTIVDNGSVDGENRDLDFYGTTSARVMNNIIGEGPIIGLDSGIVTDYNMKLAGTTSGLGSHSFVGNPRFANAAENNFQLLAGSDAIDRGTEVGINVDFERQSRPQGAGVDIGAYECV